MQDFSKLPKADLHVHFEGTVDTATLNELASKNGVPLSAPTILAPYPPIPPPEPRNTSGPFSGDFFEFIKLYVKISSTIRTPEDFAYVAEQYGRSAAEENVRGVEMYFTPTTFIGLGVPEPLIVEGLLAAQNVLQKKFGIELRWIFDIVRNAPTPGEDTIVIAKRMRDAGVNVTVIGLAGHEAGYPATPFQNSFQLARKEGFRVYAHAGETAGPESMWEAIKITAPDRIGHGVRAVEDPELLKHVRETDLTLEVCPWSNVALGVYTEAEHPIAKLVEAGIPLVIASDDPGIFGKNLSDNYELAQRLGVSGDVLEALAEKSLVLFEKSTRLCETP